MRARGRSSGRTAVSGCSSAVERGSLGAAGLAVLAANAFRFGMDVATVGRSAPRELTFLLPTACWSSRRSRWPPPRFSSSAGCCCGCWRSTSVPGRLGHRVSRRWRARPGWWLAGGLRSRRLSRAARAGPREPPDHRPQDSSSIRWCAVRGGFAARAECRFRLEPGALAGPAGREWRRQDHPARGGRRAGPLEGGTATWNARPIVREALAAAGADRLRARRAAVVWRADRPPDAVASRRRVYRTWRPARAQACWTCFG